MYLPRSFAESRPDILQKAMRENGFATVVTAPIPPVTKTPPLGNKVAVWPQIAMGSAPVGLQVPLAGSYNSELARVPWSP